jgi:hypothetical protein
MSKKVFIDCGTNLAQGLSKISKEHNIDLDWIVYSFEANPEAYKLMNHSLFPNVTFINKAVWIDNIDKKLSIEIWPGKVSRNDGSDNLIVDSEDLNIGGASNIMGDNYIFINSPENLIKRDLVTVECFDFCEFISNNFQKDDFIVVKFDIEGSEYPVLEKMINYDIIDYVNVFYIEWHNQMLSDKYDESYIIKVIKNKGIILNHWD